MVARLRRRPTTRGRFVPLPLTRGAGNVGQPAHRAGPSAATRALLPSAAVRKLALAAALAVIAGSATAARSCSPASRSGASPATTDRPFV